MSSRHIRKVLGDQPVTFVEPASEDEDPVCFTNTRRTVKNPYELLNEISESEAKEDDGQNENENADNSADSSKIEESSQSVKKKKKKKKAGKNKRKPQVRDSEATEDEIEFGIRRKVDSSQDDPSMSGSQIDSTTDAYQKLFSMESRHLNNEYELKKIFGSKVLNLERGKKSQRKHTIRSTNAIVVPKEYWPPTTISGLSSEYMRTLNGCAYWKFCHSLDYQNVQRKFIEAVESLHIENVMAVMRSHSYHIDSHIQMSEMAKQGEDMQVAAELIETALHGMESALDIRFSITSPLNRLEYKYQENRAFFILLFKHLTYVGQRACYRTSLELCKRLLTLDPDSDPLCTLLMIDFYALKARENKWLIDLYNYWEPTRNLSQLPNFAYSIALAYQLFVLECDSSDKSKKQKAETLSNEELEVYSKKSDDLLQYALLMFPSILQPLMEKCGIQGDPAALHNPFFSTLSAGSQSRGLKLLCDLYVWRCHHVWKDARIFGWLEKNVAGVMKKLENKHAIVVDYEEKRKRRYQGTPRNILRHMILTDPKEMTFNMPPDMAKETILNYDPLPPVDSVNLYELDPTPVQTSESNQGILNLLVNSFFMDVNAAGQQNERGGRALPMINQAQAAAEAAAAEDRPAAAGLQQSVTALLDAMRDLLVNVRPQRAEQEDDAEAADESEGET